MSLKRAQSVSDLLIGLGVNSKNISIIGKGEMELAVYTPDDTRHPANRRAIIQPSY